MSLLTSYGSNNKVTNRALCVRYSVALQPETSAYRVTRTAKKSYGFVGMTKEAAETCKADKIAMYTRQYSALHSSNGTNTVYQVLNCGASVVANRGNGCDWRVDIEVSEIDVKVSNSAPTNPEGMFSSENLRNYDESASSHLVIEEAHTNEIVYHTSLIEDSGWCKLLVNNEPVRDVATSTESTSVTVQLQSGDTVQLRYGAIISNTMEVQ